jgi:L-asparaginase
MKPQILLIYTGGTIGMIKDPITATLQAFDFESHRKNTRVESVGL